jgi:oligopeptide transport system substrate-binding protein
LIILYEYANLYTVISRAVEDNRYGKGNFVPDSRGPWMKRGFVLAFLCLIIFVYLPGCQNDGLAIPSKNPESSFAAASNFASATASAVASANPAGSNVSIPQIFVTNLGGEPATIDPNKASWGGELSVIHQCFDGLLGFNPDLTLKAVTASQIPTIENGGISPDGLTYTFRLRNDVTWSDGQKVHAKDYVYSIKRMLSAEVAADYASFYLDIAGAEAYNSTDTKDPLKKTALRDGVGVTAIDDLTLEIKLARVRPVFLDLMALWPVYPLREDIITRFGDQWTEPPHYIGNGPFILSEWIHQDHLTFKPNPNYWANKPKLTELTFKMITDANAALAGYKNNEIQLTGVPTGTEHSIMADTNLSREIIRVNSLSTLGFMFNVAKPPFDNLKVRQAFSCAVDRAGFVDKVRRGVGRVALSWIPPGMPGYDATLGQEYSFNPTEARRLLATAGFADVSKLPEIKFQYADTGGARVTAQFLQGQIQTNLGIDITLEPMEPKAFSQFVDSGNFTWAWVGWAADYPDPENWLPEIFGSGAGNNQSRYSNPAFDALAIKGKQELDNSTRLQIWAEAQQIIMADAPIVTMFYLERFGLLKSNVRGFGPSGMDGIIIGDFSFRDLYIVK